MYRLHEIVARIKWCHLSWFGAVSDRACCPPEWTSLLLAWLFACVGNYLVVLILRSVQGAVETVGDLCEAWIAHAFHTSTDSEVKACGSVFLKYMMRLKPLLRSGIVVQEIHQTSDLMSMLEDWSELDEDQTSKLTRNKFMSVVTCLSGLDITWTVTGRWRSWTGSCNCKRVFFINIVEPCVHWFLKAVKIRKQIEAHFSVYWNERIYFSDFLVPMPISWFDLGSCWYFWYFYCTGILEAMGKLASLESAQKIVWVKLALCSQRVDTIIRLRFKGVLFAFNLHGDALLNFVRSKGHNRIVQFRVLFGAKRKTYGISKMQANWLQWLQYEASIVLFISWPGHQWRRFWHGSHHRFEGYKYWISSGIVQETIKAQ